MGAACDLLERRSLHCQRDRPDELSRRICLPPIGRDPIVFRHFGPAVDAEIIERDERGRRQAQALLARPARKPPGRRGPFRRAPEPSARTCPCEAEAAAWRRRPRRQKGARTRIRAKARASSFRRDDTSSTHDTPGVGRVPLRRPPRRIKAGSTTRIGRGQAGLHARRSTNRD